MASASLGPALLCEGIEVTTDSALSRAEAVAVFFGDAGLEASQRALESVLQLAADTNGRLAVVYVPQEESAGAVPERAGLLSVPWRSEGAMQARRACLTVPELVSVPEMAVVGPDGALRVPDALPALSSLRPDAVARWRTSALVVEVVPGLEDAWEFHATEDSLLAAGAYTRDPVCLRRPSAADGRRWRLHGTVVASHGAVNGPPPNPGPGCVSLSPEAAENLGARDGDTVTMEVVEPVEAESVELSVDADVPDDVAEAAAREFFGLTDGGSKAAALMELLAAEAGAGAGEAAPDASWLSAYVTRGECANRIVAQGQVFSSSGVVFTVCAPSEPVTVVPSTQIALSSPSGSPPS